VHGFLLILRLLLCSNTQFTLIGFGDATYSYPAVYTTNGKTVFEGKYFIIPYILSV